MAKSRDKRIERLRALRRKEIRQARRAKKRAALYESKRKRHAALQVAERNYRIARGLLWKIRHRRKRLAEIAKRDRPLAVKDFKLWMLNGCPSNIHPSVKKQVVRAIRHGLVITATTNGTHVPDSNHYPWNFPDRLGHAIDAAGSAERMRQFTADSFEMAHSFREFFGPPNNRFVKYGQIHPGSIPNHYNHNHDSPTF